jgi:hypothetical protein
MAALQQSAPRKIEKLLLASSEGDSDVAAPVASTIGLVGWPHNTLTSIHANAGQLADLLANTFLSNPPRLLLVCHSRGWVVM